MTPKGFRFAAAEAAVKKPGRLDMGLIWCDSEASVGGVYTRNRVVAAPVVVCRERTTRGRARGVLVNSGNANACTGEQGLADARALTKRAASTLGADPESILPCSTGVIGVPLPVDRMGAALPRLAGSLGDDPEPFARAIMTTDSFPKIAARDFETAGKPIRVLGIAKGAGMIRPDMATMLGFLLTDATIGPSALQSLVARAVTCTFNRITVDGDTSTNDTVLGLASGLAGAPRTEEDTEALGRLGEALREVCRDLARMIVRDGEGATKVVDVQVAGASSEEAALDIAFTIAQSPLVKTAIHGEDPNWGRIAGALGRSRTFQGRRFHIAIGGVPVVRDGLGLGPEAEGLARQAMTEAEFEITVELEEGNGHATVTTCDLTREYVEINAEYRT